MQTMTQLIEEPVVLMNNWITPIGEVLESIADSIDSTDRPLPFPQDRRGNKAPFAVNANPYAPIRKSQGLPDNPLTDTPDFPFC